MINENYLKNISIKVKENKHTPIVLYSSSSILGPNSVEIWVLNNKGINNKGILDDNNPTFADIEQQ